MTTYSADSFRFSAWTPVADRLPASGVKVLVFFLSKLGKRRRTTAHYAAKHSIEASHWEDGGTDDDEDGSSWEPEGWWEESVEGEELHCLNHHDVTHWMPLPDCPELKP